MMSFFKHLSKLESRGR